MKDITIDGHFYFQVNTTFTYVSTHNCTNFQSLVDQGANGGVSDEDVTVINTYPHRHVKIRGIDNNDITSFPIGNIGNLAHSQAGSVIIIMHHSAYHVKGKTIH